MKRTLTSLALALAGCDAAVEPTEALHVQATAPDTVLAFAADQEGQLCSVPYTLTAQGEGTATWEGATLEQYDGPTGALVQTVEYSLRNIEDAFGSLAFAAGQAVSGSIVRSGARNFTMRVIFRFTQPSGERQAVEFTTACMAPAW